MAGITLTWDLPVTRSDGSPLDINDINRVEIEMSTDGGTTWSAPQTILPADAQTLTVSNLVPGTYHFRGACYDVADARGVDTMTQATVASTAAPAALINFTAVVIP
jgi:hypothetical protein